MSINTSTKNQKDRNEMGDILLKVGDLAKSTGLTKRTLHHYDSIGLLSPPERTDAGYRLYNRDDIARLHAIQTLRQIGLPLQEIASLLHNNPQPLPLIIQRQITALEHQIKQASELCEHLRLLQARSEEGIEPNLTDWLEMLAAMSTLGKYFSAGEIKKLTDSWKLTKSKWQPLIASISDAMARGIEPTSLEIQPLARHWMNLSVQWMKGDYELLERWGKMNLQEPTSRGRGGVDLEIVSYIEKAVELRLCALLKYFSKDELKCLSAELDDEWILLGEEINKLQKKGASLKSKTVQDLAEKWSVLVDRSVNHSPNLREKFLNAFWSDPVLCSGTSLNAEQRDFISSAWMASARPSRL